MPTDPQHAQTEQTFLALVERMNAQFFPDLTAKLNDHSIDHIAAIDAALAQTHEAERELASIEATATQLGVDPTGPLAQRVFDITSAVRRTRMTLESERQAAAAIPPVVVVPPAAPAASVPPYPITADDVLAQLRSSTDPGQMMINAENQIIGERRKSIDDITARILDSYKKH